MPAVRTVAATYLGIIHEEPVTAVPALVEALKDEETTVRSAAAAALGSFSPGAPDQRCRRSGRRPVTATRTSPVKPASRW